MTLNGVMAVILRYFSEFGYLPGALRKSSRSLSHLLMSPCYSLAKRCLQRLNRKTRRMTDCMHIHQARRNTWQNACAQNVQSVSDKISRWVCHKWSTLHQSDTCRSCSQGYEGV